MLKLRNLKIHINTDKGNYGLSIQFSPKLNIIRGDNSSGKSTIFQSILYGLGMEELIGGKNEKSMQSVLKDEVLNDEKKKEANVIESYIALEVESKKVITIQRFVKSTTVSSKLVKVFDGGILSGDDLETDSQDYYVHDAGAATDVEFGFQAFLEDFLGYELPLVQYNDGALRKLYLQNLFPGFIIEQKAGWSDFLSTIPFYNLRDKERRAVEFLLKLDAWNIEEKKQKIRKEKQDLSDEWEKIVNWIKDISRRSGTEINNLSSVPTIVNALTPIFLTYLKPENSVTLTHLIDELDQELFQIEESEIPKIADIAIQKEAELNDLNTSYRRYNVQYDFINNRRSSAESNIEVIQHRLEQIKEELYQNKQHLKLKNLGAKENLSTAQDDCPACGQKLNDVLNPNDVTIIPMNIEENILYLTSQQLMAESYINNHRNDIDKLNRQLRSLENAITQQREQIRAIKRDLVADDRLPSIQLIEQRIKLKARIKFYKDIQHELEEARALLESKSDTWARIIGNEQKLPKESFSASDFSKLKYFKENFIRLLRSFDYASKTLDDLDIPKDKLIPVANGGYSIRFDSSASDLMRAIFAFTCSLYLTSNKFGGNHPSLIVFDEPGGQETAITTLHELLKELQSYDAQSIVFASFKQSEADFVESTAGINFNLINSGGRKFIRKVTT